MEFKNRIKELREAKGLTASQLAVKFDRSEGAIRSWELGRTKPDADTLIELSKYFNVTVDYLLGLVNAKKPENIEAVDSLGLSESAIEVLKTMSREYPPTNYAGSHTLDNESLSLSNILSILIQTKKFKAFLETLLLQAVLNVSGIISGEVDHIIETNKSITISHKQLTQLSLLDIIDSFIKELENEQNR